MEILYCAQWKRATSNRRYEHPRKSPAIVAILRFALATGLIFGIAGVLDHAADRTAPPMQAAN